MAINERISFERILCPVDLLPDSDEALRYGVALAKAYGAKLFVIHCGDGRRDASDTDKDQVRKALENSVIKHLLPPAGKRILHDIIIVEGEPADAITRTAAENHVDLIVMLSRRRPYASALLGSTTESVCRTAPCPILVTHARERDWAGKSTNEIGLERVLVAYDSSSDSELALSYSLSLAQEYEAELHMLHVVPHRVRQGAPEIAFLPLTAESAFQRAAASLRNAIPEEALAWNQIKQAVREGHPYREVLAYAEEQDIDLICMGASGTGFGLQALFGSNADRVLRQAHCPVLIARPLRPTVATPVAANG